MMRMRNLARGTLPRLLSRKSPYKLSNASQIHPFYFETGIGLFAKSPPRPFPPPFYSPPSGSFSDPLSIHHGRGHPLLLNGAVIEGLTNGDDAVYASKHFICANDGISAWSTRPRGHARVWSRLILHFWANAIEQAACTPRPIDQPYIPEPGAHLQWAYDQTREATGSPWSWEGTTTVSGAILHYRRRDCPSSKPEAVIHVTSLGDSQIMILRPSDRQVLFKTKEQWRSFDCPRQLGTNSPDTPQEAVSSEVSVQYGDVVLAMTDGVTDNLWGHEIVDTVVSSIHAWETSRPVSADTSGAMTFAAEKLVEAAQRIAVDPIAESPYMERGIKEGLVSKGGKLDDISVVAARCISKEGG